MTAPRDAPPATPGEWMRKRATEAALHDLDERVVCERCHQPYLVVGAGPERRLQPDHQPTCPRYRPPAHQNASVQPEEPIRVSQAQRQPQRPPRGYVRPEDRPTESASRPASTDNAEATATADLAALVDLLGIKPAGGDPATNHHDNRSTP